MAYTDPFRVAEYTMIILYDLYKERDEVLRRFHAVFPEERWEYAKLTDAALWHCVEIAAPPFHITAAASRWRAWVEAVSLVSKNGQIRFLAVASNSDD
ncbi:hypothetical protein [Mesorhizobium sp. LSJC264A00]|uniref:hypothetical protein n=1 Tax=unclassified Mesorhizobium TaxID=325217 RepID=UPI0003CEA57A|nr:hypothetical protein [Mesorhizobium sp. LSJC264A00]ESX23028.1 hypothetical protein X767_16750 [Mesorhizobium sp. LSJC264A00]